MYELKSTEQLEFYLAYLRQTHDFKRAQDVAYFYQLSKPQIFEEVLNALQKIFPENVLWLELYYQHATQENKLALALEYLLKIEKKRGLTLPELDQKAALYFEIGNPAEALQVLEQTLPLQPDSLHLKRLGLEYYFQHHNDKALDLLQKVFQQNPRDALVAYYLSEIYLEQKRQNEFLSYARKSKILFEENQKRTLEEEALLLKTKMHLKQFQGLDSSYQKLLNEKGSPKDLEYDYVEYLLETRQTQKAKQQIDHLSVQTKADNKRIFALILRYDLQVKNYKKAYADLLELQQKNPNDFSYQEELLYLASDLKDYFFPQVSSYFEWTHFGEESFYSGILNGRLPLQNSFSIFSRFQQGYFSNGINQKNFSDLSGVLEKIFYPYTLKARMNLGLSDVRTAFSPGLEFDFETSSAYHLNVSFQYHQLKTDLGQSLVEGNLQDEWKILQQGNLNDKLLWTLQLEANRQLLKSGEKSFGYSISPSLQWTLFQKPYLSLTYQYQWSEQKGQDFLNKLPLIERNNLHLLNLNYSQSWARKIKVDASAFIGEDFSRNLHAFKGDLWGLQSKLVYSPTPALDFFAQYQYSQESTQANVGHFHQAQVGLTFYWDKYGKRK